MNKNHQWLLAILICLVTVPAFALSALDPWDAEARANLAIQVKVWLGLMLLTNLASLAFIRRYVAARWVFGGWFVSHAIGLILILQGYEFVVGQVSILHIICWTPGGIALLMKLNELKTGSKAYRYWASLAMVFYFGSMLFDVPDAITYLTSR